MSGGAKLPYHTIGWFPNKCRNVDFQMGNKAMGRLIDNNDDQMGNRR